MAEYYRILSYLYRYDNKNKIACKGFVKAEQKRNGLKITLQIDDEKIMEDIQLALCFYWKEEQWKIHPLALLETARHHEETVLFYPSEQLPDQFDIRDMYGVILFYQEFLFYGSVWVGDEIPVEVLLKIYQENQRTDHQENKDEEEVPEIPEEKSEEEPEEEKSEEEPEKEQEEEQEGEQEEEKEEEPEKETEEEPKEEDLLKNMWIDTEKKAKPVDNIFNPAFRGGYQIALDQLDAFSPEAGRLSDNQFLEKGYAIYHHLLAGKVIYAGKERYCVGVPGIYENRERYMAQLYQFPVFLSMTENRIKTGGFGYWLHLLQE